MISELRAGNNVKRFHTTHRTQEETVGHHSANVCAILLRLVPDCSREMLVAALMHDIPESYTGDVPAPFKWDHPDIAKGLKEGELAYISANEIPHPHLTEFEKDMLKVADMVDLVLSSLEEMGRGNQYARELVSNGQQYLIDMELEQDVFETIGVMVGEVKDRWQLTTSR